MNIALTPPLPKQAQERLQLVDETVRQMWEPSRMVYTFIITDRGLFSFPNLDTRHAIEAFKRFVRHERSTSGTTIVVAECWVRPPPGQSWEKKEVVQLELYIPGRAVYWHALIRRPVLEDFVLVSDSH